MFILVPPGAALHANQGFCIKNKPQALLLNYQAPKAKPVLYSNDLLRIPPSPALWQSSALHLAGSGIISSTGAGAWLLMFGARAWSGGFWNHSCWLMLSIDLGKDWKKSIKKPFWFFLCNATRCVEKKPLVPDFPPSVMWWSKRWCFYHKAFPGDKRNVQPVPMKQSWLERAASSQLQN